MSTVATDLNVDIDEIENPNDAKAVMDAMRERLKKVQTKAKELRVSTRAARTPSVKSLADVELSQAETPKLYTIQQLTLATRERTRAGQTLVDAVNAVTAQYSAILFAVMDMLEADPSTKIQDAILAYLKENAPKAHAASVSHGKKAKANAEASDEDSDFDSDE